MYAIEPVWLGIVDIITRLCFYISLEVQQRTCLFSPNVSTTLRWSSSVVICVPIKCLLMCFYCIVTTEEDHHSVVETFGEKRQVLC